MEKSFVSSNAARLSYIALRCTAADTRTHPLPHQPGLFDLFDGLFDRSTVVRLMLFSSFFFATFLLHTIIKLISILEGLIATWNVNLRTLFHLRQDCTNVSGTK